MFVTAVLALRYVVFPQIDDYRDDIAASISRATGLAVTIADVDAAWQGLLPQLTLTGVQVADRRGKAVLGLGRVEITISWWSLLAGDLRFRDVDIDRPALRLRRGADGLVYLADKAIGGGAAGEDGAFVQWLLAQPRLHIREATLAWHDELAGAPEVEFTQVDIAMRKSGARHLVALLALPPAGLAGKLDLRADLAFARSDEAIRASGTFYAQSPHADVARLRRYLPLPETLRSGTGAFRVWLDFDPAGLTGVTADVNLRGVRAQLDADALPLELDTVAGRVFYRALPGGYEAGTRSLRFRTRSGLAAESGEYTISSRREPGQPAQGEVRANGIDLKIAATLLDYLPVPREAKAQVLRFAPRGRLLDSSLVWTGDSPAQASRFRLKSRFENLAVNAVDAYPGATGLSGVVEGDEQGGNLSLDSRGVTFEAKRLFADTLALDELRARASWRRTPQGLVVAIREAHLANADAELSASGTWRELPGAKPPSPGRIDLEGVVVRARAAGVATYLPNGLAGTREYLERSVLAGEVRRARYELKGDLWHFPFRDGKQGHFLVEGEIADGRLQYHPAWPPIDRIRGSIRFENAGMEIRADEAAIYDSRVRRTRAAIADFGADPPVLEIDGEAETVGGDATRFLRESPLAQGPGAFAKVVGIDGQARLRLHIGFPLRGTQPLRVNGEYTFAGGTASVGRSLLLSGIRGSLAFTERAVKSSEITGAMFGQPATLRLASQPDNTVLTQLDGRLGATVLGAFIPEAFSRRMAGTTDWKARLVSGAEGTELRIESALKGLVIGLPEPFGKTADEARALAITIRRLGAADEEAIASLEGGVHARINRRETGGAEHWSAALRFGAPVGAEPVRDGLWLYGDLARFDLDAWREALAAPAAAGTASPSALELRGLDVRFARLRYTGRDFARMQVRLQKERGEWRGTLASPSIAGAISFDPAGRGRITARLERFALVAGTAGASGPEPEPAGEGDDLPGLDIVAERFEFSGHQLGRLELAARPEGDIWRIERLDISNEHSRLASSGDWRRAGTGPLTRLDVKLESKNLHALLAQFGHGAYVTRGEAKLEGQLLWPGFPYEFAAGVLSGRFKVEASRGQFAKVQAGAGKLLGLLSLQSLPRRITFDFRDVFSEGFAFDRITGEVKLARGVLLTSDFEIAGPSAFVSMAGEVSLPLETQSLTLRVVPEVGEGIAIAATLLGTPVMGLTTLLVQKLLQNPLGKAVSYEYLVTGSWDNPSVTRLNAPVPGQEPRKAAAGVPATLPQ